MRDILIYIDEKNNKQVKTVDIIEVGISFVKFKTDHANIITIPMTRVLKIKQKEVPESE